VYTQRLSQREDKLRICCPHGAAAGGTGGFAAGYRPHVERHSLCLLGLWQERGPLSPGTASAVALWGYGPQWATAIDSNPPAEGYGGRSAGMPGKPEAVHSGSASDFLPLMGVTEPGCKKPACCSLSFAVKASLSLDLSFLLEILLRLSPSPKTYRKAHLSSSKTR
jgi:hypothetical protein